MKFITLLLMIFLLTKVTGQEITNVVYVAQGGITEDIKKADAYIIIKRFPGYFERLDYKKEGPCSKRRSYKDSTLSVLQGNYYEYRPDGSLLFAGKYEDNKKTDTWQIYNDTGKIVRSEKYKDGVLTETTYPDKKDTSKKFDDEREAQFIGGSKAWIKYLTKSLEKSETANHTAKGGKVVVGLKVDSNGMLQDPFILKSVEFPLDEDSLEIIRKSPKWNAAWQNGHAVNSYALQPITYAQPQQ